MREQIHHETVTPAEWLFCSDGLLPCFRDNETGIRNGPAFFQQARRAPLHGSPLQPACQTAGSPTGRPPRHPQRRSPAHGNPRRPAAQPHLTTTPDDRRRSPRSTRQAADSPTARRKPASQQPPTTGHEMAGKPARQPPAGPPSPAPSCIIPRNCRAPPSTAVQPRFTTTPGNRRRNPRFTATPRPVTKWRANRHGSHPPGHRPLHPLA